MSGAQKRVRSCARDLLAWGTLGPQERDWKESVRLPKRGEGLWTGPEAQVAQVASGIVRRSRWELERRMEEGEEEDDAIDQVNLKREDDDEGGDGG